VSRFTGAHDPIYLLNLGYEGTITDLGINAGGIHANSPSAGPITVMRNCYSTGKINGTDYNGQLSGWVGKDAIVENCWSTAEVTGVESDDFYMFRRNSATQTNCYSKYGTQATLITDEQLASGELTYLLNGDQTSINFYQTIGEDSHPVLSPSHGVVYPESRIHCDGTPYVSTGAYSNKEVAQDEHDFQNGICKYCGKIDADYKMANADGYYELSEGGDLVWFASMVNAGNKSFNAILTADIDMSGYSEKYPMIGNSSNPYAGIFDGQFHTISNLTLAREQGDVALVSYAQPGCTIKNLVLDETCSASGASHTAGIVSRCTGAHEPIYLLNLGYEGIITDLGINAGGIHANSPYAGPITVMKNCYSTGKINGTAYNGQLSGWVGRDAIIEDCWSTAEVTGVESDDFYMYRRSSATHKNCYSKYGTQVTPITDEQVASGELCWMLNHSMLNYEPVWYQTLGEDEYPVFDASHEIVYRAYDIFGSVNRASIASERTNMSDELVAFTEYNEVMATQSLIDAYTAEARALAEAADWNDLVDRYARVDSLMQLVIASMDAYSAYQAKVDETKTFLAENPGIIGEYRDRVEDYLNEYSEVGERHPNGSYLYIIENHTLTTEEITAETEYLDLLLGQAIAGGYIKDSDVTSLLVNADFSKGFDGWSGTPGTEYGTAQNGAEGAALCRNRAMDMYQTLTGLKNGVYELQVYGVFHPAPENDLNSTNYGATLYANEQQNYFQTGIEDFVPEGEARDGENCLLTGFEGDYVLNEDGETTGYMPKSLAGCSVAFGGGRYSNRILANVTDGKLTVGIRLSGTGKSMGGIGCTVTAHTGAYSTSANSMDFVRAALGKKPDYLEIDIRFRPDGTLACSHDAITSNSQGENLREVFNLVRGSSVKIMLDIKETATLKALYTLLTEYGLEKQVVLAGLNEQGVVTAREDCPGIPYLLNYSPDTQRIEDPDYQQMLIDLMKTTGSIGINCNYKYATRALADVLHKNGLLLSVWTVNEEADMKRMLDLGADNMATMQPDALYALMQKTGAVADWLGFGNMKLTYRGELEEAAQALDDVLASQAARANTILNSYTFSVALDYANYPNFSQDIKDRLQKAIDAIGETENAADKYALIGTFSKLFQQVYDCKRAYINLMTQSVRLTDLIPEFRGVMTNEEVDDLYALLDRLSEGYIAGTFSIDEAGKDYLLELNFWLSQENGVYQIENGRDLAVFAIVVNSGEANANAVLTADIDMTDFSNSFSMIGTSANPYAGVFDGQFHTISNLVLDREQGDVALVSYAQPGCTIKNLTLDATCSASGASHTAGIVSRFTGAHNPIYLLNLGYEGTIADFGINAGGIHANSPSAGPITVMRNCYSTGKINGTAYNGQ
ncbi:MAG: glycerophosphodiester phosphodiesterase, partial [Bacteroidaceae bacterium]|nr:glycerophosphodiester phosphodiesterase [Bacteroidaceae bacterium]